MPLQHTRRDRRGPALLVVAAVAIAIALLKPWTAPPDGRPRSSAAIGQPTAVAPEAAVISTTAAASVAGAAPSGTASAASGRTTTAPASPSTGATPSLHPPPGPIEAALGGRACTSGTGWRLVAAVRNGDARVRDVIPVSLVASADGIGDAVPIVEVSADELEGIGYCEPLRDRGYSQGFPTRASIWRIDRDGRARIVRGVTALSVAFPPISEPVFAPPRRNGPDIDSWPPGRYALGFALGVGKRWWVGIRFRTTLPSAAHT